MNRPLVLTSEGARHPFRRLQAAPVPTRELRRLRVTMQDLREFLMAYCACFLATITFIA